MIARPRKPGRTSAIGVDDLWEAMRELGSVREVADYFGVHETTIYRRLQSAEYRELWRRANDAALHKLASDFADDLVLVAQTARGVALGTISDPAGRLGGARFLHEVHSRLRAALNENPPEQPETTDRSAVLDRVRTASRSAEIARPLEVDGEPVPDPVEVNV